MALCQKYHNYRSMNSLEFAAEFSRAYSFLWPLADIFGGLINSINTEMEKDICYEQ